MKDKTINALVANKSGEIFDLEGYSAMGMAGNNFKKLSRNNTMKMPYGGELMYLPDRIPVLFNERTGKKEEVKYNPWDSSERVYPVAAFNSPGYVNNMVAAYTEEGECGILPLFSYGAIGWADGGFVTTVFQVDRERRQDLRLMPEDKIRAGAKRLRKKMPNNRLRVHLENCALNYGCPAAKNFFIGRFEAPLPTSQFCNARCLGCISLQKNKNISSCQERINFTPDPDEITGIALEHINKVEKSVVSFGQGCEGDPLLAFEPIKEAVRYLRKKTSSGTINMNSNGSLTDNAGVLFDTGLDSMRVSMNSVRKECYEQYFRPNGYSFQDVLKTIEVAKQKNKFVAINYLNCPGISDSKEEMNALEEFIGKYHIDLIQWRNLNFDPLRYNKIMNEVSENTGSLGIVCMVKRLKKKFPALKHGYFNPPKENF